MSNTKPWLVINKGTTEITKGVIGKNGGEKPHITFWVNEKEDIRVAVWDNGNGTASFQITQKNDLLDAPKVKDLKEDVIPLPTVVVKVEEDDDLPF